jgi:hypothetical protein
MEKYMSGGKLIVWALLMGALMPACGAIESHLSSDPGSRNEQATLMPNDPALSQAHVVRARFFREQGDINKSVQEMEWALAADPYNYEAAYHQGLVYMELNQRLSARRVWEQGLRADQDGVERPFRAKAVAAMRAGLAELDRLEKPYPSPVAILASQGAYQDNLRGSVAQTAPATSSTPAWAAGVFDAAHIAPGARPPIDAPIRPPETAPAIAPAAPEPSPPALADNASAGVPLSPAYSRPGLPEPRESAAPGSFVPKPYVPSPDDGKPRAAASAPASRSSAPAAGAKAAANSDCPPCGVQNSGKYAVLVSSNQQRGNAQEQVNRLNSKGYQATMAVNKNRRGTWYVVWAGCCVPEKQARDLAGALNRQGLARDARAAAPH